MFVLAPRLGIWEIVIVEIRIEVIMEMEGETRSKGN